MRRILFVLGVMLCLFACVGCTRSTEDTPHQNDDLPNATDQNNDSVQNTTQDINFADIVASSKNGKISMSANTFIQNPALSWEYSLEVSMENEKIYIGGVLYEQSPLSITITFDDGLIDYAEFLDHTNGNQEISNTLELIKGSEPCCVLETYHDTKAGNKLVLYLIDGSLYFVSLFETGEIMRIHHAIIE